MQHLPNNKIELSIQEFIDVCDKKCTKSLKHLKELKQVDITKFNRNALEQEKLFYINTLMEAEEAITIIKTNYVDASNIIVIDRNKHYLEQINDYVQCNTLSAEREFNNVYLSERSYEMANEQKREFLSKEEWIKEQKAGMVHEVTGASIKEGLDKSNTRLTDKIAGKEKYIAYLDSLSPEDREIKIRDASFRDAKNALTNCEYKKVINEIGRMKKIAAPTGEQTTSLNKAKDRLKSFEKFCKYPANAAEFKLETDKAYEHNTLHGIMESIETNKQWIKENNAIIKKLKGLEDHKFKVVGNNIPTIIKDPEFTKQLNVAIKDRKMSGQTKDKSQGR